MEYSASRLVTSYGVFEEATSDDTIAVLERVMVGYGAPSEVLSNQRSQFSATGIEGKAKGVSRSDRFLAERGVRRVVARVNQMQTNRKIERLYQTVGEKLPFFEDLDELVE